MKKILFIQINYPGFLADFDKRYDDKNLSYRQLKSRWKREWFGQADFYGKHLERLGWKTEEVIINDWLLQHQWAIENRLIVNRDEVTWVRKLPESIKNLLGTRGWVKEILFAQVKAFTPDVVYIHDMSVLSSSDIRRMKQMGIVVVGQVACPLPLNQQPLKEFDLIISSLPHFVKYFRRIGVKSEYLRWCFEEDISKTIGKPPKRYGVVFVGGLSPHHSRGNKMFEELTRRVPVDFWGYGEQTLSPLSPIRNRFHGMVWGRQMYKIFAQAKIVVNRHINVAKNYANNMRMFDATGMGSLLVTDDKSNMKEFFEPGKEVVIYSGEADLIRKVKYYLNYPLEREKIAKAGQKRTLSEHTYKNRMKDLDKILKKYLYERDAMKLSIVSQM